MTEGTARQAKIDYDEINRINCLTDRVSRLMKTRLDAEEHICSERSRLATESWKETEGENLDLRRAKLFSRIMHENPIAIRDNELIVGTQSKYVFGASPYVDYNPAVAIENLKDGATGGSSVKVAAISEDERKSLEEDCSYWAGRSTGDAVRNSLKKKSFPGLRTGQNPGL